MENPWKRISLGCAFCGISTANWEDATSNGNSSPSQNYQDDAFGHRSRDTFGYTLLSVHVPKTSMDNSKLRRARQSRTRVLDAVAAHVPVE